MWVFLLERKDSKSCFLGRDHKNQESMGLATSLEADNLLRLQRYFGPTERLDNPMGFLVVVEWLVWQAASL